MPEDELSLDELETVNSASQPLEALLDAEEKGDLEAVVTIGKQLLESDNLNQSQREFLVAKVNEAYRKLHEPTNTKGFGL